MRFWVRGYSVPSATVIVAVNRRAGANAVEVSKSIYEVMPAISAELPGSIRVTPIYDRAQSIVHSVSDVRTTLSLPSCSCDSDFCVPRSRDGHLIPQYITASLLSLHRKARVNYSLTICR